MDPSQSFVLLLQSFVILDYYLVSIITILPFIFCSIALTRIMIKLNTHTAEKKENYFFYFRYTRYVVFSLQVIFFLEYQKNYRFLNYMCHFSQ